MDGRRKLTLVGNDGTRVDLNGPPFQVGHDVVLAGGPPVDVGERIAPGIPGALVGQVRHLPRDVILPLDVLGDDATELDERVAEFVRLADPTRGPVRLVAERADGSQRELLCYLVGGHEALTVRTAWASHVRMPIRLRALDPYWRAVSEHIHTFEQDVFDNNASPTAFDAPVPFDSLIPFDGVDAQGVAILKIVVSGDVETWPRFEVIGPGSSVEAANISYPSAKKVWRFSAPLGSGDVLTIDSRPGVRSVLVNDLNRYGDLSNDSHLWPLLPGVNHVVVRVLDYVPGTSMMRVKTRDRWSTP